MEHATETKGNPARQAALSGLAVVGFFALVFIGMMLAIYAARFVPQAANGLGAAAVYLGSVFTPADEPALEAITPVIPFEDDAATAVATTTPAAAATTTAAAPAKPAAPAAPTAGPKTTSVVPTGGTVPAALYGLPDLTVEITAVGYLTSTDTDSFVKSSTVPDGKRGAVKFTVTNVGTNASGSWDFDAKLPTSSTYTYHSPNQKSLLPSERIDFTLGFDRAKSGDDREITITVDPDTDIAESNEKNNEKIATIDVD